MISVIMKLFVAAAFVGLFSLTFAIENISVDPGLPCQTMEDCAHYQNLTKDALCQGGFCHCKVGSEMKICSSLHVMQPEVKNSGKMYQICKQNQECNYPGGICNTTVHQCTCQKDLVLSSSELRCLKKASEIGFPCTDEKQCLAFAANTTCHANVCDCISGYYFTDGACHKKVGFGEKCNNTRECSHITGAVCKEDEICGCPAETIITIDGKRCLRVVSEILQECVEDAQCTGTFSNSLCIDNKCQCEKDYHYESAMSRCFISKALDENCATSYECYQALDEGENITGKAVRCLSNTCACAENYYRDDDKCVNAARIVVPTLSILVLSLLLHGLFWK